MYSLLVTEENLSHSRILTIFSCGCHTIQGPTYQPHLNRETKCNLLEGMSKFKDPQTIAKKKNVVFSRQ